MTAARRLLAALAVALAATLAATGCDSSPIAAHVDGVTIKQTALSAELRGWAGSPGYVAAVDQQNQSAGLTVRGAGAGTYNSAWVAGVLSEMIAGVAVHQHLVATGHLPGPAVLAAARAIDEIEYGPVWRQLPPSLREQVVQRAADSAMLGRAPVDPTIVSTAYQRYKQYFFRRVCVVVTTVTTLDEAQQVAASGGGQGGGQCFTPAQLEGRSSAFASTVRSLAVGASSKPARTPGGLYRVITVTSRDEQGFTPSVQRAIAAAVALAEGSGADPAVTALLRHVTVKVNPQYGTWKAPQVVPPRAPAAGS